MRFWFSALVLVALLSATAGGVIGVRYGQAHPRPKQDLHALVHRDLNLTSDQNRRMELLEQNFATQRATLDAQMRAADRDLATAITHDHQYNAAAQAAVMRLHGAMAQLQELTVRHILAMRALLTPSQAARLDQAVDQALTDDQR